MSCADIEYEKQQAYESIAETIVKHLEGNLDDSNWRKNLEYEVKQALARKVDWEDVCTLIDLPSDIEVEAKVTVGNKVFHLS